MAQAQRTAQRDSIIILARELNENAKVVAVNLAGLLKTLNLPSNARIIHIFDLPAVKPSLFPRGVDIRYERDVLNIGSTIRVRESVEKFGPVESIVISPSVDGDKVFVVDGGTRLLGLPTSTVATYKILPEPCDLDSRHAAACMVIALQTMVTKQGVGAAYSVYMRLEPLFTIFGLSTGDVLPEPTPPKLPSGTQLTFTGVIKALPLVEQMQLDVPDAYEVKAYASRLIEALADAVLDAANRPRRPIWLSRLIQFAQAMQSSFPAAVANAAMVLASEANCVGTGRLRSGDVNRIAETIREALTQTGIRLDYVVFKQGCINRLRRLCGDKAGKAIELFSKSTPRSSHALPSQAAAAAYMAKCFETQDDAAEAFGVSTPPIRSVIKAAAKTTQT